MSVNGSGLINILVYLVIVVIILIILFWLLDRFVMLDLGIITQVNAVESWNITKTPITQQAF